MAAYEGSPKDLGDSSESATLGSHECLIGFILGLLTWVP